MVVGNKNRHSQFFSLLDLTPCRNPVVTGNDGVNPILPCLLDQMFIQSISILHSIRDHMIDLCTDPSQTFQQNICCHHSVNIIITDNPNFFLFLNLFYQNLHSVLHILQ